MKCSQMLVDVPLIADLFDKIERAAEQEKKIKELHIIDSESLKDAFTQVLACCNTGI